MNSKKAVFIALLALTVAVVSVNGQILLPKSLCADSGSQVQTTWVASPDGTPSQFLEGPVYLPSGSVLFAEQMNGVIWKLTSKDTLRKLTTITSGSTKYTNGMDINPAGELVVCEKAQIAVRDTATGAVVRVIATGSSTSSTDTNWGQGTNDLTFASNGDMFFTCWNSNFFMRSAKDSSIKKWLYTPASGINWNGIEYIQEKGIIYLLEYGKNKVVTFNVNPNTHMIDTSSQKQFSTFTFNSCDGVTVDSQYNVYICCNSSSGTYARSIAVIDPSGNAVGSIKLASANPVNCVFGGPQNKTLYIAASNGVLYKVQMSVPGRVRPKDTITSVKQGSLASLKVSKQQNALQILIGNNRLSTGGSALYDMANPAIMYNLNGKRMYSTAARRNAKQGSRIPGLSPAVYVGKVQTK